MTSPLRKLLISIDEDPSRGHSLTQHMRGPDEWFAPHETNGDLITVRRGKAQFLPVGETPDAVGKKGVAQAISARHLWAMVSAKVIDGVVADLAGPAPGWIDERGVHRIAGVPGLRLKGLPTARSVIEAHLVMDLLGWPMGRRGQRLIEVDGQKVTEYEWPKAPDGEAMILRFNIPDPGSDGGFGGPEHSSMIDPVAWRVAADVLVDGIPASGDGIEAKEARVYARRLNRAIACLEQAMAFAEGADSIPESAFNSVQSRAVAALAPDRFNVANIDEVAEAWRSLARAYARRGQR